VKNGGCQAITNKVNIFCIDIFLQIEGCERVPPHIQVNTVPRSGAPKEAGGGLPGCSPLQTPQNRNLKNTDFVDIMISEVLHDLPFSQNQPLRSADD
jgi:hypothetical protein